MALRIVVCGASGRMGSRVAALARADRRFELAAGVVGRGPAAPGPFPLLEEGELADRVPDAGAVIDFSTPEASLRYARLAARAKLPFVTGVTGRSAEQERALRALGRSIPVFAAANFSPGMNLLLHLARVAAAALPAWDAAILDVHHSRKKDAPSGSALRLAEAVKAGGGRAASIASHRVGDVVGDHLLLLAGPDERLELTHRAHSRDVFARGALEAALWLGSRKPGVYGMADLLRLDS